MRPILPILKDHLSCEVTTIVTCWKLSLIDGRVMGFTDHTSDLNIDSVLYIAASGFSPSAIENKDSFAVDNLDISGILDSSAITEEDIINGIYDFAEVEVFQVNYNDLESGKIIELRGWVGEISIKGNRFIAEIRGITQKLQQNIGELYSPSCRAIFGDSCCKLNENDFSLTDIVSNSTDRQTFTANNAIQAAGYFTAGEIEWLSGDNGGRRMEVKEFFDKQFTLALPMAKNIKEGDKFKAIAGCDKSFTACCNKFNNAVNFRGEPYVPGMDKVLATAATSY